MKVESFKCDVCNQQKQETNHWFVLQKVQVSLAAPEKRGGPAAPIFGLRLSPWPAKTGAPDEIHLCGEDCVLKKTSEFLGGTL